MIEIYRYKTPYNVHYIVLERNQKVAFEINIVDQRVHSGGLYICEYTTEKSVDNLTKDIEIAKQSNDFKYAVQVSGGTYLELLVLFNYTKSQVIDHINDLVEARQLGHPDFSQGPTSTRTYPLTHFPTN